MIGPFQQCTIDGTANAQACRGCPDFRQQTIGGSHEPFLPELPALFSEGGEGGANLSYSSTHRVRKSFWYLARVIR